MGPTGKKIKASLFATCLVDQFFPEVGESVVNVLRKLGVAVDFPEAQTCCGQPAFNDGFRKEAREIARNFIRTFENSEYVVIPSGSCTSMVKVFYPELFRDDATTSKRVQALAAKVFEFSEFLVNVLGVADIGAGYEGKITYHDACHLLRELGISEAPRALLRAVRGAEFVEMENCDQCCGFGGLFSVKMSQVSGAILREKLACIKNSNAQVVVANDAGCLMHIAGGLSRQKIPVKTMHIAELLDRDKKSEPGS